MLCVALAALFCHVAFATLSPSDKNKNKKVKELKVKTGPQPTNVYDRGLVQGEPSAKDIIVENAAYFQDTSLKLFEGKVLGFVTPVGVELGKYRLRGGCFLSRM